MDLDDLKEARKIHGYESCEESSGSDSDSGSCDEELKYLQPVIPIDPNNIVLIKRSDNSPELDASRIFYKRFLDEDPLLQNSDDGSAALQEKKNGSCDVSINKYTETTINKKTLQKFIQQNGHLVKLQKEYEKLQEKKKKRSKIKKDQTETWNAYKRPSDKLTLGSFLVEHIPKNNSFDHQKEIEFNHSPKLCDEFSLSDEFWLPLCMKSDKLPQNLGTKENNRIKYSESNKEKKLKWKLEENIAKDELTFNYTPELVEKAANEEPSSFSPMKSKKSSQILYRDIQKLSKNGSTEEMKKTNKSLSNDKKEWETNSEENIVKEELAFNYTPELVEKTANDGFWDLHTYSEGIEETDECVSRNKKEGALHSDDINHVMFGDFENDFEFKSICAKHISQGISCVTTVQDDIKKVQNHKKKSARRRRQQRKKKLSIKLGNKNDGILRKNIVSDVVKILKKSERKMMIEKQKQEKYKKNSDFTFVHQEKTVETLTEREIKECSNTKQNSSRENKLIQDKNNSNKLSSEKQNIKQKKLTGPTLMEKDLFGTEFATEYKPDKNSSDLLEMAKEKNDASSGFASQEEKVEYNTVGREMRNCPNTKQNTSRENKLIPDKKYDSNKLSSGKQNIEQKQIIEPTLMEKELLDIAFSTEYKRYNNSTDFHEVTKTSKTIDCEQSEHKYKNYLRRLNYRKRKQGRKENARLLRSFEEMKTEDTNFNSRKITENIKKIDRPTNEAPKMPEINISRKCGALKSISINNFPPRRTKRMTIRNLRQGMQFLEFCEETRTKCNQNIPPVYAYLPLVNNIILDIIYYEEIIAWNELCMFWLNYAVHDDFLQFFAYSIMLDIHEGKKLFLEQVVMNERIKRVPLLMSEDFFIFENFASLYSSNSDEDISLIEKTPSTSMPQEVHGDKSMIIYNGKHESFVQQNEEYHFESLSSTHPDKDIRLTETTPSLSVLQKVHADKSIIDNGKHAIFNQQEDYQLAQQTCKFILKYSFTFLCIFIIYSFIFTFKCLVYFFKFSRWVFHKITEEENKKKMKAQRNILFTFLNKFAQYSYIFTTKCLINVFKFGCWIFHKITE